MPAVLLSVQFRNVLPSEELLLRARALWNDLQARAPLDADGDATLRITQNGDELPSSFEVELTLPCSERRASAQSDDVYRALLDVFQMLSDGAASLPVEVSEDQRATVAVLGKSATLSQSAARPDTATSE